MTRTAAAAVDEDGPPPKKPPAFCPWCGEKVVKRWVPHRVRWVKQRLGVTVMYVCLSCKVGVRAFKFPTLPLFESKKAALARAEKAHDDLEASGFQYESQRERYRRGKCSCPPHLLPIPIAPCAVHRPLKRKAK